MVGKVKGTLAAVRSQPGTGEHKKCSGPIEHWHPETVEERVEGLANNANSRVQRPMCDLFTFPRLATQF